MPKISFTIITLNEEKNILRCLNSLKNLSDDVVIADSFSTDKTCELATKWGAKVFQQKFLGYGGQKNFAAEQCQHDWIFSIDADEELSEELRQTLQHFIQEEQSATTVFQINRRTNFRQQWIYHGGWYPDKLIRLYHRKHAAWTNPPVHENLIPHIKTEPAFLEGHLNHYSFPTFKSQIETNIKYAQLGAHDLIKKRTPHVAEIFYRPIFKFLECYIWKLGFLDGQAGLLIALNAAYSLYMKFAFAAFDLANKDKDSV